MLTVHSLEALAISSPVGRISERATALFCSSVIDIVNTPSVNPYINKPLSSGYLG